MVKSILMKSQTKMRNMLLESEKAIFYKVEKNVADLCVVSSVLVR